MPKRKRSINRRKQAAECFRGCLFIAKNEKGLKSHWSQMHKEVEESSDDDEAEDEDDASTGDDE